jgi:glycosyltransferase involved in cell wall biosynthesis
MSKAPLLSIVMPCFNERATIREIISRVRATPYDKEIVVVDDASTDGTRDILRGIAAEHREVRVFEQPKNRGKGAALRRAFEEARGEIVLIQDADLEYDPGPNYHTLLAPILDGRADVVFGSRFLAGPHRVLFYWHSVGNKVLTTISNMVSDLNLTDMETGYKVFRRDVLQHFSLEEERFGIEPELVLKLARIRGLRIFEVPSTYDGRTYEEGKKIGAKDGVRALYVLLKYGVWKRS